jgi:hypothetical protein
MQNRLLIRLMLAGVLAYMGVFVLGLIDYALR